MSKTPTLLTIYLLYEDSSKQFIEAWEALARRIIGFLQEGCQTHLLEFAPVLDKDIKWAALPSHWTSRSPRDRQKIVAFRRFLARVACQKDAVVFFHFDGDCAYQDFSDSHGNFQQKYLGNLLPAIEILIAAQIEDEEEREKAVRDIIAMIPCYSIEAWLYQNFQRAFEILERDFAKDKGKAVKETIESFEEWEESPEKLDEILQIKEQTVLRDAYNHELATNSFPVKAASEVGKSFEDSLARASGSETLTEALLRSAWWPMEPLEEA